MRPENAVLYDSLGGYYYAMSVYDRLLESINVPYQQRCISTRFGQTNLLIAGSPANPPMVLLHGMGASAPTLFNQINEFASDFYVIVPDIPGSMGKSTPNRPDRKDDGYGEWLANVLNEMRVSQAHFVGISFGGWLIPKLAGYAPNRILSATMMSSAGFTGTQPLLYLKVIPVMLKPRERRGAAFLRMMGAPGIVPAEEDQIMFDCMMRYFKYEASPGPYSDAELKALSMPTYVMMGEHEAAFKPKQAVERAKRVLPNLWKAEIVPNVGHGMITEDPDGVNRRIREFICAVS